MIKTFASLHHVKNYVLIALMLLLSWAVSVGSIELLHSSWFEHAEHMELIPVFLDMVLVFALGFVAYEMAKPTVIPSFVLAIFFGFVSQNILSYITHNEMALSMLTTIGATLILFGGGLETPFQRFRQLIGPILSIAFIGTVIAAMGFSVVFGFVSQSLGIDIPLPAIVLLGIALASTDPAAIIPSFRTLLFIKPRVKHIAVSESALNDVVGALITGVFLALFLGGFNPTSVFEAYGSLLTLENFLQILKVIVVGGGMGVIGFLFLKYWSKWKETSDSEGEADAALFLAVPIFAFTFATAFGGNGFLAVFVAGLLFQLQSHFKHVEHYFNHTIEGFMKPLIFMLLGTMVNLNDLLNVAALGILMGLIFMFILRPLVVFLTLGGFSFGKHKMTINELLFLSFVRETGVIPAVLLVSIKVAGIPGSDIVLAVGMWVILLTLVLQPPLTPFVAKALGVAQDLPPFPQQKHKGPVAVLCSRGYTFLERLEGVVQWCLKHNTENIIILHCPEDKYSEKYIQEVQEVAEVRFKSVSEALSSANKPSISFKFLGRPGPLEENIESLIAEGQVSIVFVGSKMLDYRLESIKRLQVPFIFVQ